MQALPQHLVLTVGQKSNLTNESCVNVCPAPSAVIPGMMIVFRGRTSTPCVGYCKGLFASAIMRTSADDCDLRGWGGGVGGESTAAVNKRLYHS